MATESYGFDDLPEDCIAKALSLTTPKDAGRLSAVAANFHSAAQSDAVWERFLPSDYQQIICRSVDGSDSLLGRFASKKELYLYLCDNPILIDDGLKSFWLEKWSGKKCYMMAARSLSIIWSVDTPNYWRWIPLPESRFAEVAELVSVCWLEIRGKINMSMLSPVTKYAAYLVYSSKETLRGFQSIPVEATVYMTGQEVVKNTICLDPPDQTPMQVQGHHVPLRRGRFYASSRSDLPTDTHYPKQRDDALMEVELGEFSVDGDEDGELAMSVTEVKVMNWKSGLIIEGIEIRPKRDVE